MSFFVQIERQMDKCIVYGEKREKTESFFSFFMHFSKKIFFLHLFGGGAYLFLYRSISFCLCIF